MTQLLPLLLLTACSNSKTPAVEDTGAPVSPVDDSGAAQHTGDSTLAQDSSTDTGHTGDSAAPDSAGETGDSDTSAPVDTGPTEPATFASCFSEYWPDSGTPYPDYDALGTVMGSHCYGTDHQDIADIERVVFIGDSVTVGSPPTDPSDFYRVQLAHELATTYGLDEPEWDWEWYNAFDGTVITAHSGDFWSCAKWGARTDDLIQDNDQILDCFPSEDWDKTTLVVMTMGGNDVFSLTEDWIEGVSTEDLWATTQDYVTLMTEAVAYLKDPANWGAPVYVVFANTYGYTDGTGYLGSCENADYAGFGDVTYDTDMMEMLVWANEQYMQTAVDYGADMLLLDETFCGHGFNYDDPSNRCYRGPDAELWFDLTCIHPSTEGHTAIYEMMSEIISE